MFSALQEWLLREPFFASPRHIYRQRLAAAAAFSFAFMPCFAPNKSMVSNQYLVFFWTSPEPAQIAI